METIKSVPYKVSRTKWNIDSLRLSSLFERERNFTISEPKSGLIFLELVGIASMSDSVPSSFRSEIRYLTLTQKNLP